MPCANCRYMDTNGICECRGRCPHNERANDLKNRRVARILNRDRAWARSDRARYGEVIRVAESGGYRYATWAEERADWLDATLATFASQNAARMFVLRHLGISIN